MEVVEAKKEKIDYKVVSISQTRYAIAKLDGTIIEDSCGYGYKSESNAIASSKFLFDGEKEKKVAQKIKFQKWIKGDIKHKYAIKSFNKRIEDCCKKIGNDKTNLEELLQKVEEEFKFKIPPFVKHHIIKK